MNTVFKWAAVSRVQYKYSSLYSSFRYGDNHLRHPTLKPHSFLSVRTTDEWTTD